MKLLTVKKFGPVESATIELRDINLFIGEQSIGKSTLAKLITIFTDSVSLFKLVLVGHKGWLSQLDSYNLDVYKDDDYEIAYNIEQESLKIDIKISRHELFFSMTKDGKKITQIPDQVPLIFALNPFYDSEKILEKFQEYVDDKKEEASEETISLLQFLRNSLYIPAERNLYTVVSKLLPALTMAKATVPNNLLQFMIDLQNAKSRYSEFKIPLLGISYLYDGTDDYFMMDEGRKLPLASASSGIQSALPLLLVLQYAINDNKYSSYVIEEPECNLFPEKQVDLLQQIITMLSGEGRIFTITTHSPYILSAFNNYLYAGSLVAEFGERISDKITEILPPGLHVSPSRCSVYSLGENINGAGIYCKSIIDGETGMINYNALDSITASMSDEFDRLENCYVKMMEEQ